MLRELGEEQNLKNMVILSENMATKTSKLILNEKALRFKENIDKEINLVQKTAAHDG
jgi:hypothetical protein